MCKPNCRVSRVDALTTMTTSAVHVDANFLITNVDRGLLNLRQHGNGRRRRMDTSASLGRRHTLHAMHTTLIFKAAKCAIAVNFKGDFLVAPSGVFAAG